MPEATGRQPDSRPTPMEVAHEYLPENWEIDGPKQTEKGSEYMMLFGRILGEYNEREPCIVLHRPHDGRSWRATPGRHYIDAEYDTLASGPFSAVLRSAVLLAETQNERWAAVPGFEVPG